MISLAIVATLLLSLLLTEISTKETCPARCGDVAIPFPFGTTSECSFDDSFLITCNRDYDPPKPFLNSGPIEVVDISLDGLLRVASSVASECYHSSGSRISGTISELTLSKFLISSKRNKFTAVGCDTNAIIQGSEAWSGGCVSRCDGIERVVNGTCSGIGCCQTSIPKGVKDFHVDIRSYNNHTWVNSFSPCGYAFVVETESYEFSSSDLMDLHNTKTVPVVLDWSVGNLSCREARKHKTSFACRATHSECAASSSGVGYQCECLAGFQGNPYLVDGCRDVDEERGGMEPFNRISRILVGLGHASSCLKGSCHPMSRVILFCIALVLMVPAIGIMWIFRGFREKKVVKLRGNWFVRDGGPLLEDHLLHHPDTTLSIFSAELSLMVPAIGSLWTFWRRRPKKVVKQRGNCFDRNGGRLLEDHLQHHPDTTLSICSAENLKEATENYNMSNALSADGTKYKGRLRDGQRVTITKCEELEDIQFFITTIISHTRIDAANVVRLLGCCLETPVPLLVYEYPELQTLDDHIHDDVLARSLSWDIRLRIALQTARALDSVHSDASPLILDSSSILLEHDYTVKVNHTPTFSASPRVHHVDKQGYLEPVYFSTGRLPEKSHVYSYGVVLAELLTGKKAIISDEQCLAQFFVSQNRSRDELISILDPRLEKEEIGKLEKVGNLAKRCLSDASADRPTIRDVLDAISYYFNDSVESPYSPAAATPRRKKPLQLPPRRGKVIPAMWTKMDWLELRIPKLGTKRKQS